MSAYTRPQNVMISSRISCLKNFKTNKLKWQIIETYSEVVTEKIFSNDSPTMDEPQACVDAVTKWTAKDITFARGILQDKFEEVITNPCQLHKTHCSFEVFCCEIRKSLPDHLPISGSFSASRYVFIHQERMRRPRVTKRATTSTYVTKLRTRMQRLMLGSIMQLMGRRWMTIILLPGRLTMGASTVL